MGQRETQAIILRATDFGESDRIIHFFTRDFGRMRGVAKGAKRSLKRFVGSLELLAHVDLHFFEKKTIDLVRIESSNLRAQFPGIRADLDKFGEACLLAEIVTLATGEREAHRPLFDTLARGLALIDRLPAWTEKGEGVGRLLETRLLSLVGFEPEVNACVRCRVPLDRITRAAFSVVRGGVLCEGCARGERDLIPVGLGTLRLLAQGLRADVDLFPRFAWAPASSAEAARVLHPFAQAHLGRELRTLRFLTSLARGPRAGPPPRSERPVARPTSPSLA
jgi:DNA repair protein RecO (recombination protein O)